MILEKSVASELHKLIFDLDFGNGDDNDKDDGDGDDDEGDSHSVSSMFPPPYLLSAHCTAAPYLPARSYSTATQYCKRNNCLYF